MGDALPFRSSIDTTLDWLAEGKEKCLQNAMKATGAERDRHIEDSAKFAHAFSLIRREYRPSRKELDHG
jgi:hypothetical protein